MTRRTAGPLAVVTAVVILANLLYLAGIVHPDPLDQLSGLNYAHPSSPLPGLDTIDPNNGFTSQALGHLAAMDWLHGHVPWWNPYEGLGSPLAGEMQSAALFPPVLLYALPDGQIWFHLVLELIAGYSTLFLLRRLVRSPLAAVAGASAFALNGTFAWLGNAAVNPIAFAPLLLLGIEQCLDRDRRGLSGWPLVAVAVALSVYAGFPEMAFINGLLAIAWFVVRATELVRADLIVFLRRGAAGLVCGLLLAAPILVAFLTYLPHADLGQHRTGYAAATFGAATSLPALVVPYLFGPIYGWIGADPGGALTRFWGDTGGYLGATVNLLAILALPGRRERRLKVLLAAWVVLGVAAAAGVPGIHQAVGAIPGLGHTIFYRYASPSWSLAVAVLAGLALDDLARVRRTAAWSVPVGVAGLIGLGALAIPAVQTLRGVHVVADRALWSALSIGAALVVVAVLMIAGRRRMTAVLALVCVAESVALFVVPELSAPTRVALDMGPVRYLQAHLGSGRFYTLGPLGPNYGSYWGIASANLNDNPAPQAYADYITGHLNGNVDPLFFTGINQTTSPGPTPAEELAAHLDSYRAVGVDYVVSYSYFHLPAGLDLPVVYRDRQITIRQVPGAAPQYSTTGPCRITGITDGVTVSCTGPGTLIRREQYLPGWTATDDGAATPVSPYRDIFQTVALRVGNNRVSFSFTPPYTDWSLVGLAAGLIALVVAAVSARRPAHRRRRGAPRRY